MEVIALVLPFCGLLGQTSGYLDLSFMVSIDADAISAKYNYSHICPASDTNSLTFPFGILT